ncbi:MAG: VWA domain-containing protein [Mariniblastus sp.]
MIPQTDIRTFYEFQPIAPLSQWWQLLTLAVVTLGIFVFVCWMYRRDSRDLPRGLTILLTSLRVIAFATILLYVINPGKRSETRIVKSSRLAVLVDTSLSMGLQDRSSNQPLANIPTRIDEVVGWMESNSEIQSLRQSHDLTVYRFGETSQPEPILSVTKNGIQETTQTSESNSATSDRIASQLDLFILASQRIGWLASAILVLSMIVMLAWLWSKLAGRPPEFQAYVLCAGVLGLILSLGCFAWSDLQTPQFDILTSLGWKRSATTIPPMPSSITNSELAINQSDSDTAQWDDIDWKTELAPKGTATELGSAIQHLVNKERGGPIAGIVVITDGRSNSGVQPARAIAAAANAGIPIYPIGIGTTETPKNVRVADIQAPPKVFPSDKFLVKGIIKSFGLSGQSIRVKLVSVDDKEQEAETIEDETTIRLLDDGKAVSVDFNVTRQEQGKRRYIIRTESVDGDSDPRDDQRAAMVEIVERQTKVLLMAGGPNREFRFLRNQLYRDKDILLHVLLQSSPEGADQESDVLLTEFPKTREEVFFYDCIIGFDPDWRDLEPKQSELLERWVAEQAGGLILIAGPVNTPEWTRKPRGDEAIDKIRRLYPVSFYSQGTAQLKLGRFGGEQPFPLEFSREGRASEFLWLGDTGSESQSNWSQFEGVFGYYAVNESKPGADVLANFADPNTSIDEQLPIYLASQFYGAGRVFFQASGEMWRIRRLDVDFFQQYYVKLIRWASQGRLLRDSTRGVLLTDRERCWMGDQVVVQAILRDAQDQPLLLTKVDAVVLRPDGTRQDLSLEATKNAVRPGTFNGQFTAGSEGDYRISLPIPASPDLEVLTSTVQANIPDLEKEQPQRNDSLLTEIADKTNGYFYVGINSFQSTESNPVSPTKIIQSQDQETFLTGTLDRFFQRKLMMWLLTLLATSLAMEWTIRRLHKLA